MLETIEIELFEDGFMKKFTLLAGVALMVLSSLAFVWKGASDSRWNFLAVPLYLAVAVLFWRAAMRQKTPSLR